ncbi:MAG: hypothetical protein M3400_12160 [Actinomycetota bacterium]|nr:hypothetical protein [Actinomycetota bacterium]
MSIVFRHFAVPIVKGTGTRFSEHHITFPASQVVRSASVGLSGFKLDFENPEGDRSLNIMSVILNRGQVTANAVDFSLSVQLADKNFDDEYQGVVGIVMIADVWQLPFIVGSLPVIGGVLGRILSRRGSGDRQDESGGIELHTK